MLSRPVPYSPGIFVASRRLASKSATLNLLLQQFSPSRQRQSQNPHSQESHRAGFGAGGNGIALSSRIFSSPSPSNQPMIGTSLDAAAATEPRSTAVASRTVFTRSTGSAERFHSIPRQICSPHRYRLSRRQSRLLSPTNACGKRKEPSGTKIGPGTQASAPPKAPTRPKSSLLQLPGPASEDRLVETDQKVSNRHPFDQDRLDFAILKTTHIQFTDNTHLSERSSMATPNAFTKRFTSNHIGIEDYPIPSNHRSAANFHINYQIHN